MIKSVITSLMLLFSPILHAADQNNPCAKPLMTTQAMNTCGKAIDKSVEKEKQSFTQSFTNLGSSESATPTRSINPFQTQPTVQPSAPPPPPANSTTKEKPQFNIRYD